MCRDSAAAQQSHLLNPFPSPHVLVALPPQDISALEAIKLDSIDPEAVKSAYAAAKTAYDGSEAGSAAKATAQIQMETSKAMASAVGVTV